MAHPPDQPSSLSPTLKILFSIIFGVLLGCMVVLFRTFLAKLKAEPEVQQRLANWTSDVRSV